MVLVHVEQSAGIKYSLWLHETIITTHNINSWDSPSVLLMSTLTPILTPPITASTSSVIFICRPTQALEASINLKITSTGITPHSRHYSSTLTHSLTHFFQNWTADCPMQRIDSLTTTLGQLSLKL